MRDGGRCAEVRGGGWCAGVRDGGRRGEGWREVCRVRGGGRVLEGGGVRGEG